MIEIRHKTSGAVIKTVDADTLSGADLSGADLSGADLSGANGIISFGPVGNIKRIGYAVRHETAAMVQLGCFWGTRDEAIAAIQWKYGEGSNYEAVVVACCEEVMK